jgi:hypothetical protein
MLVAMHMTIQRHKPVNQYITFYRHIILKLQSSSQIIYVFVNFEALPELCFVLRPTYSGRHILSSKQFPREHSSGTLLPWIFPIILHREVWDHRNQEEMDKEFLSKRCAVENFWISCKDYHAVRRVASSCCKYFRILLFLSKYTFSVCYKCQFIFIRHLYIRWGTR